MTLTPAVFVVGLAIVVPSGALPTAAAQTAPSAAAAQPTSTCPTGFTFNAASGFCEKPADKTSCPAGSVLFGTGPTSFLCLVNALPVQGVCPPGSTLSQFLAGLACEVDPLLTCPSGTLAGTVCQLPALLNCPTETTLTGATCVEPAAAPPPSPPAFPGFSFASGGTPGSVGPNVPSESVAQPSTPETPPPAVSSGDPGDLAEHILDSIFPGQADNRRSSSRNLNYPQLVSEPVDKKVGHGFDLDVS